MNEDIFRALTNFLQHFAPAYTIEESDEQFSTEEIFDRFLDITGDPELTRKMIHDLMRENGFVYDYVIDRFKWLIKVKS